MRTRQTIIATTVFSLLIASGLIIYFQFHNPHKAFAVATGDYQTHASGDWANTSTWERWNGSSWVNPAPSVPAYTDGAITILSGHTVQVTTNVSNQVDEVVVNSGGTLELTSSGSLTLKNGTGFDLTVNGTLKLAAGITLNAGATITFLSGGIYQHNYTTMAGTVPTATWDANSDCQIIGYTSNTSAINGLGQSFGHFTWNCPSQTGTIGLSSALTSVAGNFNVISTGSGEIDLATVTYTLTISGDFNQSGGTLNLNTTNNKTSMINVGGNYSHTGGTITVGGNSGTQGQFYFVKSGTQTFTASGNTVTGNVDFTVNTGSTLSVGTNIVTGRNFTLSSGAGLNMGSAVGITSSGASGNIQSSGTRSFSTGGNYSYNGTSSQSTGNGLPSTVNNLTINNSNGVTLTANVAVSGLLTFTSGILTTGANEVNVTNATTTSISGYSSSNYVIGNLRRSINASGSYDFPLGTSSYYELINATFTSQTGASNILSSFTTGDPTPSGLSPTIGYGGNTYVAMLNYGYWSLTPNSALTSGSYAVTLYSKGQTNANSSDSSLYILVKRHDNVSAWGLSGTPAISSQSVSNGTIKLSVTGLTTFSDFGGAGTGGAGGSLPIHLLYFNAKNNGAKTDLDWATAAEINNDYFTVERSSDGETFEKILTKQGAGNSTVKLYYHAADEHPLPGKTFYRLRQTDYDGKSALSPIAVTENHSIRNASSILIENINPNPFTSFFKINYFVIAEGEVEIQITDNAGRTIHRDAFHANKGFNNYIYNNTENLTKGICYVSLLFNGETVTRRIVKI